MKRFWIPVGFTVLYLGGALVVGAIIDQGSWVRIGTPILLFFAILSTVALWVIFKLIPSPATPRGVGVLLLTGVLCPVVITGSVALGVSLFRGFQERRTARQLAHSRISNLRDELWLGAKGNPIGVRIHYRVEYDEGLEDLRYAPFATVHVNVPAANLLAVARQVTPPVQGAYRKSTYEFTEDFLPSFAGHLIMEGTDRCLYWPNEAERTKVLQSGPQHCEISISPFRYQSQTANAYAYRTLYEGALKEGATECR